MLTNRPPTPKKFTESLTIRLNAIIATLGVILMSLPEILTQALSVLGSAEVQQLLAILPPRARAAVDVVTRVLGALITIAAMLNGIVRVVRTERPVAKPKLRGRRALLLPLITLAGLSVSCTSAAIPRVELKTIDCAAITSPAKANEALAAGQIVRIAARDLIAALYPSVIDADAVQTFDEKIDAPFTDLYRKGRAYVDSGQLEAFRGMCEALKLTVDALIPVVKSGGGQ